MKYLLKEDRMQGLIEKYIKSQFDDIVSVNFEKKKVLLGHENKIITATTIIVVVDPNGICKGNYTNEFEDHAQVRGKIREQVNDAFGLGIYEYGSKWDIRVLFVETRLV
jgi:hypothetical protein